MEPGVVLEEDRIISSHDMARELAQYEPQQEFRTGYYHLDRMTNGFKEGDLVIISGVTGNGKTEFAVSLAKRYIEQGIHPTFFSYEISSAELIERFYEEGVDLPTFYLPRIPKSKTPIWIGQKIGEAQKQFGTKIVFIDHLHYLVDDATSRNRNTSEMLGQLCRQFKQIARHYKVVIFLLCHVRKVDGARPTLDDIKDSSGIVQEADAVMFMHRKGAKKPRKKANSRVRSKKTEEDDDDDFWEKKPDFSDPDAVQEVSNEATLFIEKVRRRGGKLGKIEYVFEDGRYKEL